VNDASFAAVDRLSARIINSLHGLLGVSYSDRFEHFVYQASVTQDAGTTAGATKNTTIRISQEAAFFCTSIRVLTRATTATGTTAPTVIGGTIGFGTNTNSATDNALPDAGVLLQVTDGGNDRLLHSEAVDAGLVYGTTGNSPHQLSKPKLFKPNATVTLAITTLKTFVPATITRVALIGFKVYRGDGATTATIRGV
jgi:hypothetical protein